MDKNSQAFYSDFSISHDFRMSREVGVCVRIFEVYDGVYMYMRAWMPGVKVKYLPLLLSILFFETGSLNVPGTHLLAN